MVHPSTASLLHGASQTHPHRVFASSSSLAFHPASYERCLTNNQGALNAGSSNIHHGTSLLPRTSVSGALLTTPPTLAHTAPFPHPTVLLRPPPQNLRLKSTPRSGDVLAARNPGSMCDTAVPNGCTPPPPISLMCSLAPHHHHHRHGVNWPPLQHIQLLPPLILQKSLPFVRLSRP